MQQQWKDAYPGLLGKLITGVMLAGGRDVEQGSYSALYAATSPEIEEKGYNGYYFSDPVCFLSFMLTFWQLRDSVLMVKQGQLGKESSQASDPKLGDALWELSERIIKEKVGDDALVDWSA
jgi:hypothetical protein